MIPVFLLLGALVVDAGNWYAHKRSLQNRADAGALAAGLEYTKNNNLRTCGSGDPGGLTGDAISNVAKAYAGTSDPSVGTTYNKNVNNQSNVTVAVNATNPTALDWTDGGSPCADHSADGWSSAGSLDRRQGPRGEHRDALRLVRHQPAADRGAGAGQGRADHRRRLERPAVHRRDRRPDRVRLGAVRARGDGSTAGFTVTPSNPIQLTETSNHTWTANVTNVQFTNASDDIAIRYWGGSKNGSTPCNFASGPKKPLPHDLGQDDQPVQIDWLNVYDTGGVPGNQAPPKLRRFSLNAAGTCGGPGYLYTASTSPSATCLVGFTAEIDTGANAVQGQITVQPVGTAVSPVTVSYDTTGGGPPRCRARSPSSRTTPRPEGRTSRTTTRSARRT